MSAFFEDLEIGQSVDTGSHLFTREAIIAFAQAFDPQPFHLDDEAAAAGPFGRLAASGWHTAAVWMRHYVDHQASTRDRFLAAGTPAAIPGPSPGFRNLRWLQPVFAGDTIGFGYTVAARKPTLRPGWGLVTLAGTGERSDGQQVYGIELDVLWPRRPSEP